MIGLNALHGALAVGFGAFAAHGAGVEATALFQTGAQYQAMAGLGGALAAGFGARRAGLILFFGAAVFAGALYALGFGAPRGFGAVAPLGGVLMLAGWLDFAWTGLRGRLGAGNGSL
ncbi:MAG: DUF423 domain-containing protein [Maricaulaceae bacterium]